MSVTVLALLVLAVSYAVSRPIFDSSWGVLGLRWLFLSGTEVLLIGVAVGPPGLDLIPAGLLDRLDPMLHLGLGWAGLIFGLQFSRRQLKMYPKRRYVLAFVQAAIAGVVVAGCGYLLLGALFPLATPVARIAPALALGICAAGTSPTSLHYFSRVFRIEGSEQRLLLFVAAVDGIVPVVAMGLGAGWLLPAPAPAAIVIPGVLWPVLATAAGIALGLLLTGLIELDFDRDELLLFVLGMVVLTGGLAYVLRLSAVFLSFVVGVTVANVAWHREEVHRVVSYAEHPIYLGLLFLVGTKLELSDRRVLVLALALVALRLLAKLAGNLAWRFAPFEPLARHPLMGAALLSQGGLSLVLAIDFVTMHRGDAALVEMLEITQSAILVAILASEVLSPVLIRTVLRHRRAPV